MYIANFKIIHNVTIILQLGPGGYRRPLTMGNQTSETHENFRAQPDMIPVGKFDPTPQGFNLHSHHTEGPSKVGHEAIPIMFDLLLLIN